MTINIVSDPRHKIQKKKIKVAITDIYHKRGISGEYGINVVFIGRRKMKDIALRYKKENIALPVLSFSYLDEEGDAEKLLGEIFICYPQAVLLASEREKTVNETIVNLVDHGIETIIMNQTTN